MKKLIPGLILAIALNGCYKGQRVDTIIHNADIHVLNDAMDKASAMAVSDGKIVEVGPERAILNKYHAPQMVNAEQKDVLPGLHDAHAHIMSLARQRLILDLTDTESYAALLQKVKKHAAKSNSSVIYGRGWDQSLWSESAMPDNDDLNELFPDTPVALGRVDGHTMLVNRAMLERAEIDTTTQVEGGDIITDKQGALTGILMDHAIDLIQPHLPQPTPAQIKEQIMVLQQELFALGITHIHEAGLTHQDLAMLREMAQNNQLELNIYGMLFPSEENIAFAEEHGYYQNGPLSVRSFKVVADGSLGSHGACMIAPYSDTSTNGFLLKSPAEIKRIFRIGKSLDYQVNSHCIGDSTNRLALKIIDTLMKDEPDHRWRIEHAQIIHPDDFKLFNTCNVIPSVQPTHATTDQRWAAHHIGEQRLKDGGYAYHSLQRQSGMLLFGTDFPVESFNPFATIHSAVQRKDTEDKPTDGFLPSESVSLPTTLKAMTLWPAFGSFQEHKSGSLQQGKDATFVILDQPLSSSSTYAPNYAVQTYIEGKRVYNMNL
ncbi:MAG: amidohydrolase [Bacteroidota bacterium]